MVASAHVSLLLSLAAVVVSRTFPTSPANPPARALQARDSPPAPTWTGFPPLAPRTNFNLHQAWLLEQGLGSNDTSSTMSNSQTSSTSTEGNSSSTTTQGIQSPESSHVESTTTVQASTGPNGIVIGGSVGASIGGLVPLSLGIGASLGLPVPPLITLPAVVLPSLPIHLRRDSLTAVQTAPPNRLNRNAVCPENAGMDPKPCSECGGDKQKTGLCDNILYGGQQHPDCKGDWKVCYGWYCECKPDAVPEKGHQITTTTVIDGQTGTVTWAPSTLTAYTNLRASTTVTISATATDPGKTEAEAALVVVFAGGVAWMIANNQGSVLAIEGIIPPPGPPDGSRPDDDVCKKPAESCDKCGGATETELCASGETAGCPCKKEDKEKCPDKQPWCVNKDCQGEKTGKCQSEKLKDCPCSPFILADADVDPRSDPDSAKDITEGAQDALTLIWGGKLSNVPGYLPPPYCTHGAAPNQSRLPKEYCKCGPGFDTTWSVATTGTNPCPWNTATPGKTVIFPTQTPDKTLTSPTVRPPKTLTTPTVRPTKTLTTPTVRHTTTCDPNCADPFCC